VLITQAQTQPRGPRATTQNEIFDFGSVPQHSEISHVFWLRNTGDEPLVIEDIIPNCSCTEAPIEKKSVEPGDSTRIELIFASFDYHGDVSKFAQIKCNANGRVPALTFMSNVKPDSESMGPLAVTPRRINLNDEKTKAKAVADGMVGLTLTNTSKKPVEIKMVDKPDRAVIVDDYRGTLEPGAKHMLNVRFTDDWPGQTFSRSITFELSGAFDGRLTVPVFKKESTSGQASAKAES
jgi:hypothetical protein